MFIVIKNNCSRISTVRYDGKFIHETIQKSLQKFSNKFFSKKSKEILDALLQQHNLLIGPLKEISNAMNTELYEFINDDSEKIKVEPSTKNPDAVEKAIITVGDNIKQAVSSEDETPKKYTVEGTVQHNCQTLSYLFKELKKMHPETYKTLYNKYDDISQKIVGLCGNRQGAITGIEYFYIYWNLNNLLSNDQHEFNRVARKIEEASAEMSNMNSEKKKAHQAQRNLHNINRVKGLFQGNPYKLFGGKKTRKQRKRKTKKQKKKSNKKTKSRR